MGRASDVKTFDATAYRSSISAMRTRGERTHDLGRRTYQQTGQLPADVAIFGKVRTSRNAMIPVDGGYELVHGPAHPTVDFTDGTGSMGQNIEKALLAMERMDAMMRGMRGRYQTYLAYGVVQDVVDPHPVVQMAQWESDERIAEHIRKLVPDMGGDDDTEDYDLALAYLMLGTYTDIFHLYGLKGMARITGDEIGRGFVTAEKVKKHLGLELQGEMRTSAICQQLLERWHLYYVQVSRGSTRRDRTTRWWEEQLGASRVIIVPDSNYLAEVWAGLTYVTETAQPTKAGFIEFISAEGANKRISADEAGNVWKWLAVAESNFGAQTRLANYDIIPRPGDIFEHYRHAWPIGHPNAHLNVTPSEDGLAPSAPIVRPRTDWSKF